MKAEPFISTKLGFSMTKKLIILIWKTEYVNVAGSPFLMSLMLLINFGVTKNYFFNVAKMNLNVTINGFLRCHIKTGFQCHTKLSLQCYKNELFNVGKKQAFSRRKNYRFFDISINGF